jgi:hypothetical protein
MSITWRMPRLDPELAQRVSPHFSIEKPLLQADDALYATAMKIDVEYFRRLIASGSLVGGEPRGGEYCGLKALMLAVLDNAVQSYCGPAGRPRTEAEHWLAARNSYSPFSFKTICEVLGLDPDAARQAIRRLRERVPPRAQKRRMRPNSRSRAAHSR